MWDRPLYDTTRVTVELNDLVNNGMKLWDFDYPSYYKDDAKVAFEEKVVDHFRFRQIGQETPARFLHAFRTRVREIMPYYIQLYESVDLMKNVGDPFQAYDLTEEYTETRDGSGTVNGSASGTVRGTSETTETVTDKRDATKTTDTEGVKKFSNTPQGSIDNIDNYLTEGTKDDLTATETEDATDARNGNATTEGETTTTDTSETTNTNTENVHYKMTRKGNIGVQPLGQEIQAYRAALLDVDMKVIDDLNVLFLGVY